MGSLRKVAVITGASQGIGAALVDAYRDRHYQVVANALAMPHSDDPDILTVSGDVTDRTTAEHIIGRCLSHFGRVDTLINNAGIFIGKPFLEYTMADYAAMVAVNITGFFHLTQLAIAEMVRQRSGHVVQITTSLVDHPLSSSPAALASLTKGSLNAVTKSLAIEYAQHGVRVNAVAPGIVKTPMHSPETYGQLGALHPMGRMGEISDITDAVLYLETAAFVTGIILPVDGGQSAGH